MKKHLVNLATVAASVTLLASCSTNSLYKSTREAAIKNSKEANSSICFVQKNDGTIINYQSLELVTGPFKSPYLLANGKEKIKAADIQAYQNNKHYAVSQKQFCCKKKTHVSTETLPGFAVRMAKGRLSIYCKKAYNGQNVVDEFFVQAGQGQIVPYTPEVLGEIVKDNNQAYEFFMNKKFKGKLPEKLSATAEIYNSGNYVSVF